MKKITSLLLFFAVIGCSDPKPEITGLEGKPLPSFSLLLRDSTSYLDSKDIPTGKPFVLFFFSPACPYCRAEMDEIEKNAGQNKDLHFYTFTVWPLPYLKSFYKHYHVDRYPNIVMGQDYKNFFGPYFKTRVVPYIAVYGKDRRLRAVYTGNISYQQLEKVAAD